MKTGIRPLGKLDCLCPKEKSYQQKNGRVLTGFRSLGWADTFQSPRPRSLVRIGAAKIRIVVHDGDQSRRRHDVLPADGASRVPGHGVVDAGPAEEVAARGCRRVAAKVQAEGTP